MIIDENGCSEKDVRQATYEAIKRFQRKPAVIPDISDVVRKVAQEMSDPTISIPRITVVPAGELSSDDHAELLQDLASQVVAHLRGYLPDEEQVHRVLQVYQRPTANEVFSQMQPHYWEGTSDQFEVHVSAGFTPIRQAAVKGAGSPVHVRIAPRSREALRKAIYTGFTRALQDVMKFDSNQERMLAIILDRESQKWFRPAQGQFQITYRHGITLSDYHPDFVAELGDRIVMLEPKASNEMDDPVVLAKKDAAVEWCRHATNHSRRTGGKPWQYALIPHNAIMENQTLDYLLKRYGIPIS